MVDSKKRLASVRLTQARPNYVDEGAVTRLSHADDMFCAVEFSWYWFYMPNNLPHMVM